MTNGNGNLREKVEFPLNEPVVLKLDYNDGVLRAGQFGDQYQYTFDAGTRIAWLDPEVRTLIQKSGAKAGDEIAIAKREAKGQGGRRRVTWEVERVEEEPQPNHPANATYNAEASARANQDTRPKAAQRSTPRSAPRAAAPQQVPLDNAREEFTLKNARLLADCIAAAAHAAVLSEDESKTFELHWQQEDIRAWATTLYINANGGKK